MNYYRYCGHTLCSQEALPYEPLDRLPADGEIVFLFSRQPLAGRESFPVTAPALLTAEESGETLNASIFVFGGTSIAILLGIAAITSAAATFLPVFGAARKKPVEAIRAL